MKLCLLILVCSAAWSQTGVVRSSAHPIPGATVTARIDGQTFTTTSGLDGRFAFTGLPSGKGTVDVEMFGFEPAQHAAVLGPLGPELEFNLQLATSPMARRMAQFAGGRSGQTDQVSQLENELTVQTTGSAASQSPSTPASSNETFLVSGSLSQGLAPNTAPDTGFAPPPGGISGAGPAGPGSAPGFQSDTGGFAGGFGGAGGGFGFGGGGSGRGGGGGGQWRQQRAGTRGPAQFGNRRRPSQIHGMLFGTLTNSVLDAKPFSLSGSDLPQPAYAQARFGFLLGGPLVIPKIVKDPNTFFSFSYFGTRAKNPQVNFSTVPTQAEREGDFSQAVQSTGANGGVQPVQIFDPTTHVQFPGNQIPASMLNGAAQGLLSYIPLPNAPGLVNNYFYDSAIIANTDNLNGRIQRNITAKDRLAYHLSYQDRNGQTLQPFGFTDLTNGYGLSTDLTWTHNFGPTLINNARVTFNRNRNETDPYFANGPDVAAELGIGGTSSKPANFGPPNLNFTNFASLTDSSPILTRNQGQGASDSVILVRGQHSFTFGFQYQRNDLSTITDQNGRGTFNFTGLATSALNADGTPLPGTGYDFADFLLGLPQSSSIRYGDSSTYFSQNVLTGYVNDDWKAHPRLTLNLGLRYEYFSPFSEKYNHIANLDIAPDYSAVAVVLPGETGPFSGEFPAGLVNPQYHNFSPRVGLAWKVPYFKRSTIVRSGYGIYYNPQTYQPFALLLAEQPPFAVSNSVNTSVENMLTLQEGFISTAPSDITNTFAIDKNYKVPYAQTWNLAIQRELGHGVVTEITYLGTKGTNLDVRTEPNEGPSATIAPSAGHQLGNAVGFIYDTSQGNSIYNALQVRVQQRFRRGLSWQLHYTYSKSIDDSTTFGGVGNTVAQNWLDLSGDRGLSSFDRRHVLTGNWVLTSPIGGQGSRYAAESLTARLLRDWQLSGGITAETGTPLTARILGNTALLAQTGGVGSLRADATGARLASSTGFFDLGAFVVPAPGTFGNAGRNTIPGPGLVALNLAFGRSFQFGETRRRLELRLEANNVLNAVNYTNVNTVVNSINYGAPLATSAMRQVDAVLRFRF